MNGTASAFGYVRVSTMRQATDGGGLDVQRAQLAAWATYQGLPLEVFADEGISGASTDNRPGFRRAVRAALESAGAGAVLVVYKLDRLGRNALDVQETLAVLLDAGVRVVALADGVDSGSGMGAALLKLLTGILATFAELEKEGITARLQDGRRRASAENRTYTREPAYGRRRVAEGEKALAHDPGETTALETIRALAAAGLSYRAIAAHLDAAGVRPRRAAGWSPAVIGRIVTGKRTKTKPKASSRVERARAAFLAGDAS